MLVWMACWFTYFTWVFIQIPSSVLSYIQKLQRWVLLLICCKRLTCVSPTHLMYVDWFADSICVLKRLFLSTSFFSYFKTFNLVIKTFPRPGVLRSCLNNYKMVNITIFKSQYANRTYWNKCSIFNDIIFFNNQTMYIVGQI